VQELLCSLLVMYSVLFHAPDRLTFSDMPIRCGLGTDLALGQRCSARKTQPCRELNTLSKTKHQIAYHFPSYPRCVAK
jgi:hypothetical protein